MTKPIEGTYINSRGLSLDNMVYVAGMDGRNLVAAKGELGVKPGDNEVFVQTQGGDKGIYHPNMVKEFQQQYDGRETGDEYYDGAMQNLAFCRYVNKKFVTASDELNGMLKNATPEQKTKLQESDRKIRADVAAMDIPEADKKSEICLRQQLATAEMFKGTDIGNKAQEAYALGSYDRDMFSYVSSQYGMPLPGQKNPCNQEGQTQYDCSHQIQDTQIKKQMENQRTMQLLSMMSMFGMCGMGFFPFMMMAWM